MAFNPDTVAALIVCEKIDDRRTDNSVQSIEYLRVCRDGDAGRRWDAVLVLARIMRAWRVCRITEGDDSALCGGCALMWFGSRLESAYALGKRILQVASDEAELDRDVWIQTMWLSEFILYFNTHI